MNATLAPATATPRIGSAVDSPLRMVWTVQTDAADRPQLTCRWTTDTDHAATESPIAQAA